MPGFANPTKTFVYRHEEWDPDSEWVFRANKGGADEEVITNMTTRQIIGDIDQAELRKAYKRGEDIEKIIADQVTIEQVMSTQRALLAHMSVSWKGPDFTLPEDYTDEDGNPHPLAGQVPPVTAEWIGLRDGDELDDIAHALNKQYAARSDKAQATFREKPAAGSRRPRASK